MKWRLFVCRVFFCFACNILLSTYDWLFPRFFLFFFSLPKNFNAFFTRKQLNDRFLRGISLFEVNFLIDTKTENCCILSTQSDRENSLEKTHLKFPLCHWERKKQRNKKWKYHLCHAEYHWTHSIGIFTSQMVVSWLIMHTAHISHINEYCEFRCFFFLLFW